MSLELINNIHFHIPDLNEYADKVLRFGEALVKRNQSNKLYSYVLYYNNGPEIYISMVWTDPAFRGQGIAKYLIQKLINSTHKEITLEVDTSNAAKYLYTSLGFIKYQQEGTSLFLRYPRRLSIMQPYVFPYIGYFHLIESTDEVVFYDDVNYIRRGWINRNRILVNNSDFLSSQNKLISEVKPLRDSQYKSKLLSQLKYSYSKAPYYKDVIKLIEKVMTENYSSIADLAINSIISVYRYLDKDIIWTKSSISFPETKGIDKADRLIQITKKKGYKNYVNSAGGKNIYDKNYFTKNGVKLQFIKSNSIEYRQFNNDFVPWLSIIDILMFNDKKSVEDCFAAYQLE
jgi:hypothetical protein